MKNAAGIHRRKRDTTGNLKDLGTHARRAKNWICVCASALFVAGCGPLATSTDTSRNNEPHALDASAVFCAMADAVDHQMCRDSTTLARLVEVHRRHGWIDDAAVTSFDSAFPDAATKQRDLTSDDSARLRSLK